MELPHPRPSLQFQVKQKRQGASGGSWIVCYDVELIFRPVADGVNIELLSTFPPDADSRCVALAMDGIRRGAAAVLAMHQTGAIVRVQQLLIHDVDFKPQFFERVTSAAFEHALSANS